MTVITGYFYIQPSPLFLAMLAELPKPPWFGLRQQIPTHKNDPRLGRTCSLIEHFHNL